jgi:hypothetical protein
MNRVRLEPIEIRYIVEREILVALPCPVGNAHVIEARQKDQRADEYQRPRSVGVLEQQTSDD